MKQLLFIHLVALFSMHSIYAQSTGNVAIANSYIIEKVIKPAVKEGNEELNNSGSNKLKTVYEGKKGAVKPIEFIINLKEKMVTFRNDDLPLNTWVGEVQNEANYTNLLKTGEHKTADGKILYYNCNRGSKKCQIVFMIPNSEGLKMLSIMEKGKDGTVYVLSLPYFFLGE